jgi:hypothetical protein
MSFKDLASDIDSMVTGLLKENYTLVSPRDLGLDGRCPGDIWIHDTGIVIKLCDKRPMEYFGGLEYVAPECVTVLGSYVEYSSEDCLIRNLLNDWEESFQEE